MRIRSDGNILIGMQDFSSTPSASNHGISLHNTNNASVWAAGSATTNTHIIWANTNGTVELYKLRELVQVIIRLLIID